MRRKTLHGRLHSQRYRRDTPLLRLVQTIADVVRAAARQFFWLPASRRHVTRNSILQPYHPQGLGKVVSLGVSAW
jgi:hypothetical protein